MAKIVHGITSFGLVVAMMMAVGCGSDKDDDKDTSTGTKLTFATDINPIIKASCSASTCHGTVGAGSTVYEGNEAAFIANKVTVKANLNGGLMPKTGYTISAADKAKLISFLDQ